MITINVPFAQTAQLLGLAGRTGENEARRIVFDCSSVLAEFPEAKIICAIQRACDRAAYLKEVTMSEGKAALVLTDADVAAPGEMRLELRAVRDGQTLKSALYTAEIAPALRGGGSAPGSPEQDMLDRLQSAANEANAAALRAQETAEAASAVAVKADQAGQTAQSAADAANAAADSAQDVADTVQEKLDNGDFVGAKGEPGPAGTPGVSDLAYVETWYQGVDLTQKFAAEIADYSDAWAWIRARIQAGDYDGIHVCDYIPFTTTNSRTFNAQVGGINTYKGYGDTEVGNHIDFITKELWPDSFQMNLVNFNNGSSETAKTPWLASNGYLYLNSLAGQVPNSTTLPLEMADVDYTAGGMYYYLPTALKNVIVEKRVSAPTRYSASGVLTNDNSGAWVNLGKLWLPDEYEITGARLIASTGWFSGGFVQYPIFAHSMNRAKRANGGRYNWWASSAFAGVSTYFVSVYTNGQVSAHNASGAYLAPFCFRIA